MRPIALLFALALALALLPACQRVQNPAITGPAPADGRMVVRLAERRTVGQATELVVSLHDEQGAALTGATVQVEGNMAHAGMEPLPTRATERAPGSYVAALEWSMAGAWTVRVTALLPNGTTLSQTVADIEVAAP